LVSANWQVPQKKQSPQLPNEQPRTQPHSVFELDLLLAVVAAHGAGSGNLSFDSSKLTTAACRILVSQASRKPSQVPRLRNELTMAQSATTTAALLPRFYLRRDEANVIHTRLMADIENICHYCEVEIFIPFDEHHLLRPGGKNSFQLIQ
jgi:hypothetical protein